MRKKKKSTQDKRKKSEQLYLLPSLLLARSLAIFFSSQLLSRFRTRSHFEKKKKKVRCVYCIFLHKQKKCFQNKSLSSHQKGEAAAAMAAEAPLAFPAADAASPSSSFSAADAAAAAAFSFLRLSFSAAARAPVVILHAGVSSLAFADDDFVDFVAGAKPSDAAAAAQRARSEE